MPTLHADAYVAHLDSDDVPGFGAFDRYRPGDGIETRDHLEEVCDAVESLRTIGDGSRETVHRFHYHFLAGVDLGGRGDIRSHSVVILVTLDARDGCGVRH